MRTRSGHEGNEAIAQQDRIDSYNQFVTNYFGAAVPVTNNKRSKLPIKFIDGTDPNDPNEYFTSLPPGDDVKYTSIKFKLRHLVNDETYEYLNNEVNKFHYMKLKLSKLIFGLIIFKYESDLNSLISLCHEISSKNSDLTNFIRSIGNAMNGNYEYQHTKESWLHDFKILDFIIEYLTRLNDNGTNGIINQIPNDEIIKKNASTTQIIQYIADQMSVNIKNCIKNNIKVLIRIYIEYKMQIKQEKKKIRLQEKDIGIRNELRNLLYTQRKIIQSIIFQYPIEVLLTYYIHSLLYYLYIIIYFFILFLG
jgi:hypothetical protein